MKWFNIPRPPLTLDQLTKMDKVLDSRLKEMKDLTVPPTEDQLALRRNAEGYMRKRMLEYLYSWI